MYILSRVWDWVKTTLVLAKVTIIVVVAYAVVTDKLHCGIREIPLLDTTVATCMLIR